MDSNLYYATIFAFLGTGKTSTLVEAAKQILRLNAKARLLLCAPSNNAADLLTQRLLGDIDTNWIFRMHALCRPMASVPPDVFNVSNVFMWVCNPRSILFYNALCTFATAAVSEKIGCKVIITRFLQSAHVMRRWILPINNKSVNASYYKCEKKSWWRFKTSPIL